MSSIRADILVAAKREVSQLARQGRILTPREAWLMSGHVREQQTLWSIAFRFARAHDCSAEELNRYLEHHFPHFANENHHATWSELETRDKSHRHAG